MNGLIPYVVPPNPKNAKNILISDRVLLNTVLMLITSVNVLVKVTVLWTELENVSERVVIIILPGLNPNAFAIDENGCKNTYVINCTLDIMPDIETPVENILVIVINLLSEPVTDKDVVRSLPKSMKRVPIRFIDIISPKNLFSSAILDIEPDRMKFPVIYLL
jgi:hypothetical protein